MEGEFIKNYNSVIDVIVENGVLYKNWILSIIKKSPSIVLDM